MKNQIKCLLVAPALLALLTLNHQLSTAFAQGSLIPPGPPGPTMLTLSQVEPRTPISSLPCTITNPGSYYLTTNLTVTSGDGIIIVTNDVTLDLNGFTLQGGAGNGINVPNPQSNLAIRNGVLDSWGGDGVKAFNANNSEFERLRIFNCGGDGLDAGINCVVLVCSAIGNYDGIGANSNCVVHDCTASANSDDGIVFFGNNCTVIACTADGNTDDTGILVGNNSTIKDCTASGNGSGVNVGNNCTVIGCTLIANNFDGIYIFGNNCTVKDCTASANTNDGIYVQGYNCQVTGNTCSGNAYGISVNHANAGNSITRNSAPGNGSAGYANYTSNNDYGPTNLPPSQASNPWANF